MNKNINPADIIHVSDTLTVVVDRSIQPVNGYYFDTFIKKVRNTSHAEYEKSDITLQIIATIGRERLEGIPAIITEDESHIFELVIKNTGEKVWKYFYNDQNGLNQHSENYSTKQEAINGYRKHEGQLCKHFTEKDMIAFAEWLSENCHAEEFVAVEATKINDAERGYCNRNYYHDESKQRLSYQDVTRLYLELIQRKAIRELTLELVEDGEEYIGFAGHTSYPTFNYKLKIHNPSPEGGTIIPLSIKWNHA